MLKELLVERLGVIERAELTLEPGSTALTGETGAGKTLLVVAAGLLLGARADRVLVREGASEALIQARFAVPPDHPACAALAAHGLLQQEGDDEVEIVMLRSVGAKPSGGKARVNGTIVTLTALAEIAGELFEIAGQHEHQRIGGHAFQRAALDRFAGREAIQVAEAVADAARRVARVRAELAELREGERAREREADVLRYEVDEIARARVTPGEIDAITAELRRVENAEATAQAVAQASALLSGDGGAEERAAQAARVIEQVAPTDPQLSALAERVRGTAYDLADVSSELGRIDLERGSTDVDELQERLATLGKLRRKYGDDEREILAYLERAQRRLFELEGASSTAEQLALELARHSEELVSLSARLSETRAAAAPAFARAVRRRLEALALPGARFDVELAPHELYEGGAEMVRFTFSANPGEPLRPLSKVASGGELSRLALALHLVSPGRAAPTIVFDEIDAGVGGTAARAVGLALAELGRGGKQVLVVTHLPQVAAHADYQLVVTKSTSAGRTRASVVAADGAARVAELSRMLSGLPESDSARDHAQELLDVAAGARR